jgi:hypothetical protein
MWTNFAELRYGEVQHSPGPDGPGSPARGCPYRRVLWVLCPHTPGGRERAGPGYYVVLSRILQVNFAEFLFHALG